MKTYWYKMIIRTDDIDFARFLSDIKSREYPWIFDFKEMNNYEYKGPKYILYKLAYTHIKPMRIIGRKAAGLLYKTEKFLYDRSKKRA